MSVETNIYRLKIEYLEKENEALKKKLDESKEKCILCSDSNDRMQKESVRRIIELEDHYKQNLRMV